MATEFVVGGHTYAMSRLDAFKQLKIARRLAPLMASFRSLPMGEGELKNLSGAEMLERLAGPLANALADMKDEDAEVIVKTCLGVPRREQVTGGWASVTTSAGHLMFDDIELPTMLDLTGQVIMEHLSGFFPSTPQES